MKGEIPINELEIFENPEFGKIRTVAIDGEPWFVGKDVAKALGYINTKDALLKHVDSDDRGGSQITTPSGEQQMTIINESGVYSLIFSSKLPKAKEFKHWVTSEVLPSIRKTGGYMTPEAQAKVQAQLIQTLTAQTKALTELANTMAQMNERITALEKAKPKEVRIVQKAEPDGSASGVASLANTARRATMDMGGTKWDAGLEMFRIFVRYGLPVPGWAKSLAQEGRRGYIHFDDFL